MQADGTPAFFGMDGTCLRYGQLFSNLYRGVVDGKTYSYDAAFLLHCISCKIFVCQHQNDTNGKCARQQQSTTVSPDRHIQTARQVTVSLNQLVRKAHYLLYY